MGDNVDGNLGNGVAGDPVYVLKKVTVTSGPAVSVVLTRNGKSTCALLETGAVECWGNNGAGQLGRKPNEVGPRSVTSVTVPF